MWIRYIQGIINCSPKSQGIQDALLHLQCTLKYIEVKTSYSSNVIYSVDINIMLMTTITILRSPSPASHLVVSSPVKPILRKGEAVDLADIEGRRRRSGEGGNCTMTV